MILKVGLTGGIASGKSTVAGYLARLGAVVVDADQIVRDIYRPGQPGHRALVERFGDGILTVEGEIDRPALSRMALSTAEGASALNRLIHPLVIEEEHRRMRELDRLGRDAIVVVEATLLLESGGRDRYDRIIVVDTDPAIQLERAIARGLDEDEVRLRMSRQMPRAGRLAMADFIIDSTGSIDETHERTEKVWQDLVSALDEH